MHHSDYNAYRLLNPRGEPKTAQPYLTAQALTRYREAKRRKSRERLTLVCVYLLTVAVLAVTIGSTFIAH
jgi:hypothetical protein